MKTYLVIQSFMKIKSWLYVRSTKFCSLANNFKNESHPKNPLVTYNIT